MLFFAKPAVRVQAPSFTPQSQILLTDRLAQIKELENLSKGLEETRGSFNVCEQNLRQGGLCVPALQLAHLPMIFSKGSIQKFLHPLVQNAYKLNSSPASNE